MDNKKILVIEEITCYGQASSNIAVSILSAFGNEVALLPTSISSTHNIGFTDIVNMDLTDFMEKTIDHYKSEHIQFDTIYVGKITNGKQFDIIKEAKEYLLRDDGLFIVDPSMGKNGDLDSNLDIDIISGYIDLSSIADFIIPNVTEACLMTRYDYSEYHDDSYINGLISELVGLGSKNIIITSVMDDEYSIGCVSYDGLTKTTIIKEKLDKSYPGIGDLFSSLIVAYINKGLPIKGAIDFSTDYIYDAIENTVDDQFHDYGLKYENLINEYINKKDPRY
jgi:pyridoxine kinase